MGRGVGYCLAASMHTLVCFALKEEAAPFKKLIGSRQDVSVLVTGIGKGNSEKAVRKYLASRSPELVLTCGFAGGLNPDLKLGDVVFLTAYWDVDKMLVNAGARPVTFFCGDRMVITAAEKKALRAKTGAWAVEMESLAIHDVCRERSIPCATVRVISDTADEDLPLDFNKLSKPDKNLDFGKLAWAIAKSPGKIPELMRLQKKTKFAAEQLAKVLMKVLDATDETLQSQK